MLQKISTKLIILILMVGLIPLAVFAWFAIGTARKTSVEGIVAGNARVAQQFSGRVEQYVDNVTFVLKSLGQNLSLPGLDALARAKILRNYSLAFDEFRLLRVARGDGTVELSSELDPAEASYRDDPHFPRAMAGETVLSEVFMTDTLIPAATLYLPMTRLGTVRAVLVAEIDLLHLWRWVEGMKVGERGYLNILTRDGRLFATGSGRLKPSAVQMAPYADFERARTGKPFEKKAGDESYLVVSARLRAPMEWTVTVEQPADEAYALPHAMERRLAFTVAVLVLALSALALTFTRREFLRPINALMARIREIARGQLAGRVDVVGAGEFSDLARTLNEMSEDMIRFQQELVRRENQALLGRLASSIAHDLKHPVTSVENYVRLLQIKYDDPEYRRSFSETVTREFSRIQVFLNNLKDLAREIPHAPVRANPAQLLRGVVTSFVPQMESRGVRADLRFDDAVWCRMDVFSMQRVLSNLVSNAIEAMPGGGTLTVVVNKARMERDGRAFETALLEVADTGIGIAPERLPQLFDELKTTKKTGLGLGLAISHKIVAQHGGRISVFSEPGQGTRFSIHLPLAEG